MKIAVYVPLDPGSHGGIEKHVLGMAHALRGLGVEADVYCKAGSGAERAEGVYDLGDFRTEGYDIVNSHSGYFSVGLWRALRGPGREQHHVHTSHNAPLDMVRACGWWWNWRAYKAYVMEGYWAKRADHVIAVSERVKRCTTLNYGRREEDVTVIHNGHSIGAEKLREREAVRRRLRGEYGIAEEDFVVLFIGRSEDRVKGSGCVVEALGRLQQRYGTVKLMAIPGTNFPKFPWILATGGIRHERIYEYYLAADVFVNASLDEGHPLTVVESMACGAPVIAAAAGGIPDTVRDGENGLLLNAGRTNLAEQMERLMKDEGLRRRLGDAGRRTAEGLTWEAAARRTIGVYDIVLQNQRIHCG